jgi:hypothetical protein
MLCAMSDETELMCVGRCISRCQSRSLSARIYPFPTYQLRTVIYAGRPNQSGNSEPLLLSIHT